MAAVTLLVVDSLEAAQLGGDELRGEPVKGLSTHCAAAEHLAARGIESSDCSELIEPGQARLAIRNASATLDAKLCELDETVGAAMAAAAGLPRVALFHAAFKYLGQYKLAGLECFQNILAATLTGDAYRSVRFYHAPTTSDDPVFSFLAAARRIARDRGIVLEETAVAATSQSPRLDWARFVRLVAQGRRRAGSKLRRTMNRRRAQRRPRDEPSVLLLAPLEDSFFERALAGHTRLLYAGDDGLLGVNSVSAEANRLVARMQAIADDWLQANAADRSRELQRRLVAEMNRNARAWLGPLVDAHFFLRSSNVTAAAWDIPPVARPQLNLLAELCLRSGIPVLGRQHGASYGDQDLGRIHFDSDFDRCTHFFTYGFGARELAAAYPAARPTCRFLPAGNRPLVQKQRARPVDIVFPISHRVPLLYLARMPEAALARRQQLILEAMDARTDLRCAVKPAPGEHMHDERLRRLRHVQVVRTPWTEYLERCAPRLVVCEVASTAMLEALPLHVDIFLMLDPLFPFSEPALEMLRKRAHVFDAAEGLAAAISAYGRAPLARLRDRSYYDTYVNRGSPETVLDVLRAQPGLAVQSATS